MIGTILLALLQGAMKAVGYTMVIEASNWVKQKLVSTTQEKKSKQAFARRGRARRLPRVQ